MRKKVMNVLKASAILIVILLAPIVVIYGNTYFVKLGLFIGKHLDNSLILIDTKNYILTLNEYLAIIVTLLGILVTAIFSWFIWKVNKRSSDISEKLVNLEVSRDKAAVYESAIQLYYIALLGTEYMYLAFNGKAKDKLPSIDKEWMKSFYKLNGKIDTESMKRLYQFNSDIFQFVELHNSGRGPGSDIYRKHLKHCKEEYFDKSCIEYTYIDFGHKPQLNSTLDLLKLEYIELLMNIQGLMNDNRLTKLPDTVKAFYKNGNPFYEIKHLNCVVKHKKFWNENGKVLEDTSVEFDGGISGYKNDYQNKILVFEGEYKNNMKFNGKEYRVLIEDSEGYNYYQHQAMIEKENDYYEYFGDPSEHYDEEFFKNASIPYKKYSDGNWRNGKLEINDDISYCEPI